MMGSVETAGCACGCVVAVGADVVPGGTTVATSAWFNGTGLLTTTGVEVSWAITGVEEGTMGVAVFTTGMGLGRLVAVATAATRGVGVAEVCVGVAATTAFGFAPQLARSKALITNKTKIE